MTDKGSLKSRSVAIWLRCRRLEIIALAVAMLIAALDQITKLLITSNYAVLESRPVIEGVLSFTYVRNDGAVFGSLSGKPYIFNTVTVIIVVAAMAMLLLGKIKGSWLIWTAALIISGGIGNMIDRFRLGYVVDFIDVKCFGDLWIWVFNIADCCVVIGCIMLIVYFAKDMINDIKKEKAKKQNNQNSEDINDAAP